jgi:hypothetical protein
MAGGLLFSPSEVLRHETMFRFRQAALALWPRLADRGSGIGQAQRRDSLASAANPRQRRRRECAGGGASCELGAERALGRRWCGGGATGGGDGGGGYGVSRGGGAAAAARRGRGATADDVRRRLQWRRQRWRLVARRRRTQGTGARCRATAERPRRRCGHGHGSPDGVPTYARPRDGHTPIGTAVPRGSVPPPRRRRRDLHSRRLLRRLRLLRSVGLRVRRRLRWWYGGYYGGYYDPWYGGYPTYPQSSYTSSDEDRCN